MIGIYEGKINWKKLAIILMVIVFLETGYGVFSIFIYNREVRRTQECYYEICEEYPQALYQENVCFCYGYDMLGGLEVQETKLMD